MSYPPPPICEYLPSYRCPVCPDKPRLGEYTSRRKIRYLRCWRCPYRCKVIRRPPVLVQP